MIKLIELIVIPIYKLITRLRIYWIARKYGYRITEFEWLPESDNQRIARITPTGDGFDHIGDDCPCDPIKTEETDDLGSEYTLIRHREMNLNDSSA